MSASARFIYKFIAVAILVSLASLLLLSSSLFADDGYAVTNKYKQHKKYEKTIKSYNASMVKQRNLDMNRNYGLEDFRTYFTFADIDKNGIDELIIKFESKQSKHNTANSTGYNETTTIYTIKNGKVKRLIDNTYLQPYLHNNYVRVYKGSKYIDRGFSHGYEDLWFFKYSKGRLSKNPVYSLNLINKGSSTDGRTHYVVNNKETSAKKYKALRKKLKGKNVGYKMYLYSSKTLSKHF